MTLSEWAAEHDTATLVSRHANPDRVCINGHGPGSVGYWGLWNLSDYRVDSVAGGSVWLYPCMINPNQECLA